ncbi:MAG: glycosyltransferase, partial [Candidatus Competibacterales bacterium]
GRPPPPPRRAGGGAPRPPPAPPPPRRRPPPARAGGPPADGPVVLVRAGANLGFAGGNNIGLRYALARGDGDYVWLLNNDTAVEPRALAAMVARCQGHPRPAACGSTLVFYHAPQRVQALAGGPYNPWTGIAGTTLGRGMDLADVPAVAADLAPRLAYLSGASCLMPRDFLTTVGLMTEDYFLYFEEIDWALRARGRYDWLWAPEALVYHKEGGSIGSPSLDRPSSALSDFYIFRNKLVVVKRFFPWALPIAYGATAAQALNRLRRGQRDKAWLILQVMLGKRRFP